MNDINVGEYCRTNDGTIGVIEIIEEQYTTIKTQHYHYKIFDKKLIKSHSKNIIDLIEEGDYVNGSEVINITEAKRMNPNLPIVKVIEIERDYGMMEEYEPTQVLGNEIESIVTHEQFNSIKYVLGGKEE